MNTFRALSHVLSTGTSGKRLIKGDEVAKQFNIIVGNIEPSVVYLDEPMLKNPNTPYDAIYFDKEYRGLYMMDEQQ